MGTSVTDLNFMTGFGRRPASGNNDAWKKLVGQKPVSARLSVLPETKMSRKALLSSTLFQVGLVTVIVAIPMFFPQKLVSKVAYSVIPLELPDTTPVKPTRVPPPPKVQTPSPPIEQPAPVQQAKMILPKPLPAPKPQPVVTPTPVVPKINEPVLDAKLEPQPIPEPARPREPVKVGNLSSGSSAVPTVNLPPEKVQTGGFGDPNGLPGPSNPNKQANIGHFGSPALPAGPGYGNGTGGANGVRGTVASAGFGNGTAVQPASSGAARGPVQAGGFANETTSAPQAPKAKPAEVAPAVVPVVILAKPDPVYSDEARKLHIEGDVLVDVVFPANGPVRVVRVVKGLGHGLDEAAQHAAEQIRFKPAMQNGMPVDFPAVVHIEFQLAY